ncbi:MAG: alpha/beta fold hydrolase [Pseudomonadota bacterium]
MPQPVVIETGASPDAAVILLHGLGADGHDFEPIVSEMRLPAGARWRFVFPHAPHQPVTINGGLSMPSWYDILGLDRNSQVDEAGIRESVEFLRGLIAEQQTAGIARERIVVAGFSQGGAVALFSSLTDETPVAGVLALSTYLPLSDTVAREHANHGDALPILMVHGEYDPVLPLPLASQSRDAIQAMGYTVRWQTYPMPHSVCAEEIELMREWLLERLPV